MEKELNECCSLMIKLLDRLLEQGKITEKEHEKHVTLKKEFLDLIALIPNHNVDFPNKV